MVNRTGGVVVCAAIVRDARLLAAQRAKPVDLAGYWELPGGQVEDGEDEKAALRRECGEELAVDIVVGDVLDAEVALPGGTVLRSYAATLAEPTVEPVALEHKDLRWVRVTELDALPWLPADYVLLPALRALLAGSSPG